MKTPRVKCYSKDRNNFHGFYKGFEIIIERQNRKDPWYIMVFDEDGYAYDGWWTEPQREDRIATRREAVLEALRGSLLWKEDNESK
jgi:hypothetical protein